MANPTQPIRLIECPRDAMQGINEFIPTEVKAGYLNKLLKVGFDYLDFGSFVSPKAIPQMSDTADVIRLLDLKDVETELLAIVGNMRGAERAMEFDEVDVIGYPFSVSETFLQRNINSTIESSLETALQLQNLCEVKGKDLVIYVSMAFGNPYGDMWDPDIVAHYVDRLVSEDIETISLADTVGTASPENVRMLFSQLIEDFPKTSFGGHFHARPDRWEEKIDAAFEAGCTRFDGAILGFGGCPMAEDELVGNVATENLVNKFGVSGQLKLDMEKFAEAVAAAGEIFHI
ncbi:MAG: hydroxymethylglutaryl-CoA lyase [Flavobacteriales bacterium]|nr:hydroxymethylglutaryl-CoA lyase [Flavobacteriales bacterium]MCB9448226.1 hydroxymethylglutaryl-CoA lyase [Flavobacteriales bacterium]